MYWFDLSSVRTCCTQFLISSGEYGSKYNAPLPPISVSDDVLLKQVTQPDAKLSKTGIPNPSYSDGNIKAIAKGM